MKNLLITRFSALGDVAMTLPVVYDACRSNPDVHFFLVTRPVPAKVFVSPPYNLSIISVDLSKYKGIKGMKELADDLMQRYHIDAYADLHDVLRTKLLRLFMRMKGVKVAHIHKMRHARKALTRKHNKVMLPLTSSRAKYREVFHRLGMSLNDTFTGLFREQAPTPEIFKDASAAKQPGEIWIGIAPFAQHAGKIYPMSLMKLVVDTLAARPGYKLFLFGAGDKEKKILAEWQKQYPENLINMAEKKIGLAAELALLYYCDAMISMDSANMHLASLVRIPVISIWGATHPYCGFMGWHQRRETTVQLDMICRPCSIYGNKPCSRRDYHCLAGIPPSLVISRLDDTLNTSR